MREQQAIERDFDYRAIKNRTVGWLLAMCFVLVGLLWYGTTHAQTPCTVGGANTCFVASKTTGEAPITTTLTWNVVGASSCTAGNTPGWQGSVPASGTRTLTGVGVRMTLTLDCTAPPTAGRMRVSWVPPTTHTNGTPVSLGGYYIDYGTASGALTQTINLAVPGASAYDVTGLTAGTWFAAVRAASTGCFPTTLANCYVSLSSNVASKAVTTTPGGALPQLSLLLDPYLVPSPPTNVVITDVTAFRIDESGIGTRVALTPLRSSCAGGECTVVARVEE